jgi:hypothetical protein
MSTRMAPHYCPYCADQDLRPHATPESTSQGHLQGHVQGHGQGHWECRGCLRVFTVSFVGVAGVAP